MKRFVAIVCMLGYVTLVRAQTKEEVAKTIAFLQKLQTSEGGFAASKSDEKSAKTSLRASSSAVRALKYFDGKPEDADACAKFVAKCFDKDSGGFADVPDGKPDVTTTAIGLMAVVELKMPVADYRDAAVHYLAENAKSFEDIRIAAAGLEAVERRPKVADDWLAQIAKMHNEDGTFGKDDGLARDTGGAAVIVLRLGGKLDHQDRIVKAVKAGQRKDGAFGKAASETSDLESTYRILRFLHMVKEKPVDVAALKQFIAKCRNDDGGYGAAPGEPSGASGTYFASIILHWLKE
jgi:prenyltransferase beta subunit